MTRLYFKQIGFVQVGLSSSLHKCFSHHVCVCVCAPRPGTKAAYEPARLGGFITERATGQAQINLRLLIPSFFFDFFLLTALKPLW